MRCTEAHRALELLEEYHSRLTHPHDRPLRLAIERIMRIFKSRLFQALVGKFIHLLSIMNYCNYTAVNCVVTHSCEAACKIIAQSPAICLYFVA